MMLTERNHSITEGKYWKAEQETPVNIHKGDPSLRTRDKTKRQIFHSRNLKFENSVLLLSNTRNKYIPDPFLHGYDLSFQKYQKLTGVTTLKLENLVLSISQITGA